MCLALLTVHGCDEGEEPADPGPGEIDLTPDDPPPGYFTEGPATQADLDRLRQAACVNVVLEPETPKPSLELVIDVSGSMALTPPDGSESKWVLTRDALRDTVDLLPQDASLGVVYYPNKATTRNCIQPEGPCDPGEPAPVDTCINTAGAFPLGPWGSDDSDHQRAFEDALTRVNPAGGTPTHDALLFGLKQLEEAQTDGQRVLVLLTDGQPTYLKGCRGSGNVADPVDPTPIIATIAEAASEDIATFVVGVPGSEETSGGGEDARRWLSEAAIAGHTAPEGCADTESGFCHFDLTEGENFADALNEALEGIVAQAKSCDFPLPDPPGEQPFDRHKVNVLLIFDEGEGLVVGRADGECEEGYVLVSSDTGDTIHLCGETCARYRETLDVKIELILGCESAPLPPPT